MKTSYKKEDVILLLKDITGIVPFSSTREREEKIQRGTHYSEMLPIEYKPTNEYLEMYQTALKNYSKIVANATSIVSEKIYKNKGSDVVIVSLARAGTPIGILIKEYLSKKYDLNDIKHYSISIIRGKEIDHNALKYILERHDGKNIQFVDGWIGKGAIQNELKKSLENYSNISPELAVLSDPANITRLCGTREDILIPSSCLNATVSGLISRTFLKEGIIGASDFHGAVYYWQLENEDLSYDFIEEVKKYFTYDREIISGEVITDEKSLNQNNLEQKGIIEVLSIAEKFQIGDINLIKPGIGETTRVLLRRVPWKILINKKNRNDPVLLHLLRLAQEKDVTVEYYDLNNYKACGIIKEYLDI